MKRNITQYLLLIAFQMALSSVSLFCFEGKLFHVVACTGFRSYTELTQIQFTEVARKKA